MNTCQQMDITLSIALRSLAKDAQQAIATKERDVTASGSLDFLLERLGQLFLNEEQQRKIQTAIELHKQCLYPYAYASPTTEARTHLPTFPEH